MLRKILGLALGMWLGVSGAAMADTVSIGSVVDGPLPSVDERQADLAPIGPIRMRLAQRRAENLARFRAYVAGDVFPINSYTPGALNVFIDEEGHICAAATIMTADGHGDLVRAQAAQDNFIRLSDVHEGPIYDWIMSSGFTQEEIAMIQEPFIGGGIL